MTVPRDISIHAAREGGDDSRDTGRGGGKIFQSTPPVKAATLVYAISQVRAVFQSTPPVKAATWRVLSNTEAAADFNPRRP